ncbi:MAG TPA: glycine cleavage system aminomethyltransferase GcvT [Casimicrobiaceae bacterium]|nr:glycine cleavage system aminomethyltransferase GcvT [Casimicrobiaceae bacterium]
MDDVLKTTPLDALHREAGARMVDFGGYAMPLNYGSQIEEHHAVRRSAGMFDVSHMRALDLHGAQAQAFLRLALANDVAKLATAGRALYSCLLRDDGGVLDDLIVYRTGELAWRIVVNASTAQKDEAWFRAIADQTKSPLSIEPRDDLAIIAVQGPLAREKMWQALAGSESVTSSLKPFHATQFGDFFIARTGYTGEDGFEIILPATKAASTWHALRDAGVAPCGLGARDTLRLEAGLNLYGQDMDETVTPLESGLRWTVSIDGDRDFIGKHAILDAKPTRKLAGLVLDGTGGVLRAHQAVHSAHGAGEITSGTFSPTMSRSIALARIPSAVTLGENVDVDVRGKRLPARVVKPPFVRNGKVLV